MSRLSMIVASCLLVTTLCGCAPSPWFGPSVPRLAYLQDIPQPIPVNDLPQEQRIKNWVGRAEDGMSGGSCVHASTINCFRAAERPDLEAVWRANRSRGYEGPETGRRISNKLREQNIPFVRTIDSDSRLLEEASRTNRTSIIFYYPSHCVNFVRFDKVGDRDVAILLDNNFRDKYIVVDRSTFEKSWRYYGGFALTPWIEPMTPRTFPRAIDRRYL